MQRTTSDASGNKLEKQTTEAGYTTRTDYIGGYVYRNDTLQLISHEEGRIRPKDSSYVYDYFIKDHLGNTRMVLTEERQQDIYPAATLESGSVSTEQNYYTINTGNIASQPVSLTDHYPNNNGIPNPGNANADSSSRGMYKLNAATGDKMGLGITLKVMSGDTVSIMGRSYWHSNGSSVDNNYSIPVNDLLLALTNPGSIITAKGYTYSLLEGLPVTPAALQGWLDNAPANGSNPKAYLNWVLLDEQMKPVTGSSGFDAVGATDELRLHAQTVNIPKNGYLYVYCSNQSDQDVFFDNLQVVHTRGPLLEETHYYPFGLTMAGISSRAAGKVENKKNKFQGQELDDDLGLNWYGFKWRNHDPQIGRFIEIDPLSEKYVYNSTYAFSENKVTGHVELEGLEAVPTVGVWSPVTKKYLVQGDVNDDMVVDKSERESWSGATLSWLDKGAKMYAASTGLIALGRAIKDLFSESPSTPQTDETNSTQPNNNQGSGQGRGSNNRKPDPNATGDHTVSNDRGSTTYKKNDKNPTGFDEAKRVDTKGKAHKDVPTPHVHEKGKPVRSATQDEIPKTDLSKNKPLTN